MDPVAVWLVIALFAFIIIGLPVMVAFYRGHPNRWLILILTVAAGATVVGWLIALVWSLHGFHRGEGSVRHGGESGLNFYANDDGDLADDDMTEPEYEEGGRRSSAGVEKLHGRATTASSAVAQLERLIALREAGDIDRHEYETLKRTILTGHDRAEC